jgi:hypothetical protein
MYDRRRYRVSVPVLSPARIDRRRPTPTKASDLMGNQADALAKAVNPKQGGWGGVSLSVEQIISLSLPQR